MVEFVLFVGCLVEVCPLQDVKNIDTSSKEKIGLLRLYVVICLNNFIKVLNCLWFAGDRYWLKQTTQLVRKRSANWKYLVKLPHSFDITQAKIFD
jgi:hypothetical protein